MTMVLPAMRRPALALSPGSCIDRILDELRALERAAVLAVREVDVARRHRLRRARAGAPGDPAVAAHLERLVRLIGRLGSGGRKRDGDLGRVEQPAVRIDVAVLRQPDVVSSRAMPAAFADASSAPCPVLSPATVMRAWSSSHSTSRLRS